MSRQPLLTLEEEDFVERKVKRLGSSTTASYLFWFFFGVYGVHRFYNGTIKSGIALLSMHLIGLILCISGIFSIVFSVVDFSTFSEFIECVEKNPQDQSYCEDEFAPDFEKQFSGNWGANIPKTSIALFIIGSVSLFGSILWWLVDAFLIPGLIKRKNRSIRHKCIQDILKQRRLEDERQGEYAQQQYYGDEQGELRS